MDSVVAAAIAEAEQTGKPVAELSLDRIAVRAGMSRSTIFRRVGSRQALEDAVRQAGIDPGRRPSVRDRAIDAAAGLIVAHGVGALTVDDVARRVGCAVTSVHTQLGGRDGLLAAVFERHAPLPRVERLIETEPDRFADLAGGVRAIYAVIMSLSDADLGVLEALFAEALARPSGTVMRLLRERILPRISATIGGWLATQVRAGRCADLPLPVLLPLFVAPISVHVLARRRLVEAGLPVPGQDSVIDAMTDAFCHAVGARG
jgi:AcrR family transcriptional regulator